MSRGVVIFSGGLDSTTLLYDWVRSGAFDAVFALSVDYGQRHAREILCAEKIARELGVVHEVADLRGIKKLFGKNALTHEACAVPNADYAPDNMKTTVVPNRNMIFLALAGAWAASLGAGKIGYAAHSGDHNVYPDCRPQFAEAMDEALGLCDYSALVLERPYVNLTKADIVRRGAELGVPFEITWSCYEGGDIHCGHCATCRERKQAFRDAGVSDPTEYLN